MSFDALAYFEKLKSVGFTEEQARLQADTFRIQADEQRATIRAELAKHDEINSGKLATKGDIRDVEEQIAQVRLEIEKVRGEMQKNKNELLKWQIGGWVALATIMAKGFGWIGF